MKVFAKFSQKIFICKVSVIFWKLKHIKIYLNGSILVVSVFENRPKVLYHSTLTVQLHDWPSAIECLRAYPNRSAHCLHFCKSTVFSKKAQESVFWISFFLYDFERRRKIKLTCSSEEVSVVHSLWEAEWSVPFYFYLNFLPGGSSSGRREVVNQICYQQ